MTYKIKINKKFTLTELIFTLAIFTILLLLISTLYYTSLFYSDLGIREITITTQLLGNYNQLVKDFRNSTSSVINSTNIQLIFKNGEVVNYSFSDGTLYRNNISIIKYLKDFNFSSPKPSILKIHIEFEQSDMQIKMPSDFYIYKRN